MQTAGTYAACLEIDQRLQTSGIGAMAAFDKDNINTVWAPMAIGLFGVGGVLLPSQVVFSGNLRPFVCAQ